MLFLSLLLSYLCGAVPFGVIAGKLRGVDVRLVGSGNTGATNVYRALGPRAGAFVLSLDILKGLAAPYIGRKLLGSEDFNGIALCALMAVIGHTFSVFLKFRGGKGIATGLGAIFGLAPLVALIALGVWGVVLLLTRMISAASIVACMAAPIAAWLAGAPPAYFYAILFLTTVAFLKHIPNMKRILAGAEPKVGRKPAVTTTETKGAAQPAKH
ncbi:MAG TPA: glycerol-3-phosphate 1-O-acyltransferase PlsY [Abditibacteriaceae bacterium]|nr:glycerol-3-phosphate 1-O-acyltransferase PlsY [Abditibacteriaceae bacterium]